MKPVRLLILSAAFVLATSLAHAQQLWGASRYGMTVQEVQKAFPQAHPPANGARLGDGSFVLLRQDGIKIANRQFYASFGFMSDHLVQVTLSVEVPESSFDNALVVFGLLFDSLRFKYGPELSRTIERDALSTAKATWAVGRADVDLNAIGSPRGAIVYVTYEVRVATDADNL